MMFAILSAIDKKDDAIIHAIIKSKKEALMSDLAALFHWLISRKDVKLMQELADYCDRLSEEPPDIPMIDLP